MKKFFSLFMFVGIFFGLVFLSGCIFDKNNSQVSEDKTVLNEEEEITAPAPVPTEEERVVEN